MGKYERREAYEAGRAAAEQDRPAADNPHNRGDGLLRQAWNTGWREVTTARQEELGKQHAEEMERLRAAVKMDPSTTEPKHKAEPDPGKEPEKETPAKKPGRRAAAPKKTEDK